MTDARTRASSTVLVTGATGFIGSRLVTKLRAEGESVRALALPGETVADGVELARGDLRDPASLAAATRGVDVVLHLAARVGDWGPESEFVDINVEGTRRLASAAAAAGARRLVFVSSLVVYGRRLLDHTCREELPTETGIGPYSRSKTAGEALLFDLHERGAIEVAVIRPGNVFGPGSPLWVGAVAELLRRRRVPLVDGGDRDARLTYVDNVADAIALAGCAPAAAGRAYNINDGSGVTWRTYLCDLAELAGAPTPTRSIPRAVLATAARAMEALARLRRSSERPLLTREAVRLLAGGPAIPIERARKELAYSPAVGYRAAMQAIAAAL